MRRLPLRPVSALSFALLAPLAGAQSVTHAAHRPTLPSSAVPVRWAVIGDYGKDDQEEADVAALVKSWNPAFVVGRWNLPKLGLGPTSLAGFDRAAPDENAAVETALDARWLVEGVDLIAVELHQASTASDDLSFDLRLLAR